MMLVFGGSSGTAENRHEVLMSNCLFLFHFEERRWERLEVENRPKERRSHLCVVSNKKLYIFGGYGKKTLSDMHFLPLTLRSWSPLQHASFPRFFKEMVLTVLLCNHRKNSPLRQLPKQVVLYILKLFVRMNPMM